MKAIVTGFFPGMAVGAAVMFLVGLWMRRREMKANEAASARGGGGGGEGGGPRRSDGGDSRSTGRHTNASGGYKDSASINVLSAFAAGRSSKRVTTCGVTAVYGGGDGYSFSRGSNARSNQRTRSAGAKTMISSTEIAIGYDRKQDEEFYLVGGGGGGRGTPANRIVISPTPPPVNSSTPPTRLSSGAGGSAVGGAARGYDSDLRSPRHFIPEELSGSTPSIKPPVMSPSPQPPGGGPAPTAVSAAARRTSTSPPAIPPSRIRTSLSPVASTSGGVTSIPLVPLSASTARKPLPAPLTHEHLLQHQQQHHQQQLSSIPGSIAPKAQSECRSEDASSFVPTSVSYSDDGSSDDHAEGGGVGGRRNYHLKTPAGESSYQRLATNALDPSTTHHRCKKPKRPPSDVTSCITDGDHDDGLTTFTELAAAGVLTGAHQGGGIGVGGMGAVRISQAGTKSTSVADRESVAAIEGSPFVGEGDREREERVAVDWGVPPPLPEGYGYEYRGEGGRRVVAKNL